MKPYLLTAAVLYALDQASKALVLAEFRLGDIRPVVGGFFDLVYVANTGAAFGMFQGIPWFFTALKVVALGVIIALFWSGRLRSRMARTIGALLLAGVAGNLTDRMLHGHVVDFLSFNLGIPFADPWPAFNVADACITVAACLLFIHSFTAGGERAGDAVEP